METATKIAGFTVGRIVHYQKAHAAEGWTPEFGGECRAAMIVRTWNAETGMANLSVFSDHSNDRDGTLPAGPLLWRTSVAHRDHVVGNNASWHWPQDCDKES